MCVKIQNSKFKNSAKSFSTYIYVSITEADVVVVVVVLLFSPPLYVDVVVVVVVVVVYIFHTRN